MRDSNYAYPLLALHVAGRLLDAQASSSLLGKKTLAASFSVVARWSDGSNSRGVHHCGKVGVVRLQGR